jgi:hypothetical protein
LSVKNRPSRELNTMPFTDRPDLLTDIVFLVGNGKSRKDFNLEQLRGIGTIIGCNALYREFTPDLLIVIDAKMMREVKAAKYSERGTVIIPRGRTVVVPDALIWKTERYNTSGCFGMKMITQVMKPKKCYMLGMDGYPGNMYDKSLNYAASTLQNFTGVNNYYLKSLAEGETIFVNINEKDAWPKVAHESGKYEFISYEEFKILMDHWRNR